MSTSDTSSMGGTMVEDEAVEASDWANTWSIVGHTAADETPNFVNKTLGILSPMFTNAVVDSSYIRAALGNIWFLFPVIGLALGIAAANNTHGQALPPSTELFLALAVLGIIDAFSGMIAFLVFAVVAVVTGHVHNYHTLATIFVLAVLWFGGAELVHRLRPFKLADGIEDPAERWWKIFSDFAVMPVLAGFIMKELTATLPWITGYEVPIAKYEFTVGYVAAGAMFVRAVLNSAVLHNYRKRISQIGVLPLRQRSMPEAIIFLVIRAFVVYVALWCFLGNRWQTFVTLALFLSFEPVMWLGKRLPESTLINRIAPKNIAKLVAIIVFAEILLIGLQSKFPDKIELMGWAFVILGAFAVLLLFLEQFKGRTWPDVWATRLMGALVVIVFVALLQGWIVIS